MDFLNKGLAQVSELFRSMTPAARVTAGLLLLVVVVALGYLFNHQMAGPDDYLFGGEAAPAGMLSRMEGAFAQKNLSSYVIEGSRIKVPRGARAQYMAALVDGDALPPKFNGFMTAAANSNNLFGQTKQKQLELRRVALQEELAMTIRSMRGMEDASVLIDSTETGSLTRKPISTASVSVKSAGTGRLDEERVSGIRHLVAAAVAGLAPENVVVTDLNSNETFVADSAANGSGVGSDQYNRIKRLSEKAWEDKVLHTLAYIPGVKVTANVDLSTDLENATQKQTFDPKSVPSVREEKTTTSSSTTGGSSGGRPGVSANGPNQPAAIQGGGNSSNLTEEKTDTREQNMVPSTTQFIRTVPLVPKQVYLNVSVPTSYLERLWRERNPAPAGQEAKKPDRNALDAIAKENEDKIQKHVAGLFPPEERDKTQRVTVSTFMDAVHDALPTPSAADHALGWLGQYWGSLGMGFLGVFSIMTLRSMVRSAGTGTPALSPAITGQPARPSVADQNEEEPAAAERDEPAAPAQPKRKRHLANGSSAREELVEIVRENPDAAANILRTWIGSST